MFRGVSTMYVLVLMPAILLAMAGLLGLYMSHYLDDGMRTFGRRLSFWGFASASLFLLGAIYAANHDGGNGAMFGGRPAHERMHGPWPGQRREFEPRQGKHPDSQGEQPDSDRSLDAASGAEPQAAPDAANPAASEAPASSSLP